MPHQCVHCGKIYPEASQELLLGCGCGSRFFFYIKKESLEKVEKAKETVFIDLSEEQKVQMEKDAMEIIGVADEEIPVILDLESVRVVEPGKFEIDIIKLFSKKHPLIYKLEEGKYIIDLASSFELQKNAKHIK